MAESDVLIMLQNLAQEVQRLHHDLQEVQRRLAILLSVLNQVQSDVRRLQSRG